MYISLPMAGVHRKCRLIPDRYHRQPPAQVLDSPHCYPIDQLVVVGAWELTSCYFGALMLRRKFHHH